MSGWFAVRSKPSSAVRQSGPDGMRLLKNRAMVKAMPRLMTELMMQIRNGNAQAHDKNPVTARPAPSAEVMAAVNRAKQLQIELELDGGAPPSASKRQETEQVNVASDKPRPED